ncbi:MAG: hypothetical protein WC081_03335 [Candidatus Ratteibacteria bacterium]|jgi:hypothetical protein
MTAVNVIVCVYNVGKLFKNNSENAGRLKISTDYRKEEKTVGMFL